MRSTSGSPCERGNEFSGSIKCGGLHDQLSDFDTEKRVKVNINDLVLIGVLGFDSRRGLGIFLFTTASRTVVGHTQPPIQWVPGSLSPAVKWPGRETDHSPQSSAEVKE
jgi:hypothetical protein